MIHDNDQNPDNFYSGNYKKAYDFLKNEGILDENNDPKKAVDTLPSKIKNGTTPRINALIDLYSIALSSTSEKNSENFRIELNSTISKIINK